MLMAKKGVCLVPEGRSVGGRGGDVTEDGEEDGGIAGKGGCYWTTHVDLSLFFHLVPYNLLCR